MWFLHLLLKARNLCTDNSRVCLLARQPWSASTLSYLPSLSSHLSSPPKVAAPDQALATRVEGTATMTTTARVVSFAGETTAMTTTALAGTAATVPAKS